MKRYVRDESCDKCGEQKPELHYNRLYERLDLTCKHCGYVWNRRPLDHGVTLEEAMKRMQTTGDQVV